VSDAEPQPQEQPQRYVELALLVTEEHMADLEDEEEVRKISLPTSVHRALNLYMELRPLMRDGGTLQVKMPDSSIKYVRGTWG
jgi:hypothetical protein